ncbi:MAG: hypothetical protein GF416_03595 [Candidatus Altiarchaeales archaeon]|nr:hypothetical protein [Candidatus Altiarchaeales archaeon]MBD3416203.1 hypothetical protein [Candidatus Altiarchaeales archaeon]
MPSPVMTLDEFRSLLESDELNAKFREDVTSESRRVERSIEDANDRIDEKTFPDVVYLGSGKEGGEALRQQSSQGTKVDVAMAQGVRKQVRDWMNVDHTIDGIKLITSLLREGKNLEIKAVKRGHRTDNRDFTLEIVDRDTGQHLPQVRVLFGVEAGDEQAEGETRTESERLVSRQTLKGSRGVYNEVMASRFYDRLSLKFVPEKANLQMSA